MFNELFWVAPFLIISVFFPATPFRLNIIIGSDSNCLFVDTKHLTSRKSMTRVKFPSKKAPQIDTKFTLDENISGLGNSSGG